MQNMRQLSDTVNNVNYSIPVCGGVLFLMLVICPAASGDTAMHGVSSLFPQLFIYITPHTRKIYHCMVKVLSVVCSQLQMWSTLLVPLHLNHNNAPFTLSSDTSLSTHVYVWFAVEQNENVVK